MPGLLSSIFDQAESSEDTAAVEAGIDLSVEVAIALEAEAEWRDAEGTAHHWSSDSDLAIELNVGTGIDEIGNAADA